MSIKQYQKLFGMASQPEAQEVAELLERFDSIIRIEKRSSLIDLAEELAGVASTSAIRPKQLTNLTIAEQAQRFRDKAAEAEQLMGSAETAVRRQTLASIADMYYRTADQLERLGKPLYRTN